MTIFNSYVKLPEGTIHPVYPVHPSIAPLVLPQVGKATAGAKAVAGVIQLQQCGVHGTAGIFRANVPYWMDSNAPNIFIFLGVTLW
jgi:hypothetical protein